MATLLFLLRSLSVLDELTHDESDATEEDRHREYHCKPVWQLAQHEKVGR